jgi:acyl transferase domain-containing protein/NAD(P)-dependent dehydrogenase (short-subunit alcohol dehydrogenase family)
VKQSVSNNVMPVAITGIGCMFPKASGTSVFWSNITSGVDCLTEIPNTHWLIDDYYDSDPDKPDHTHARTGGFLDPVTFDPMEFGIAPNALEATDTSQLLTLLATKRALADAGYDNGTKLDKDRVSIILGVTGAQQLVIPLGARLYHPLMRKTLLECGLNANEADEITRRINDKLVGWQEASFPGLLGNVVAGRIANRFDFGGTNCVVDAACAGSLASVHTAMMELQTQKADMVITGGVDTFNDIFMYMCFSKTKALSPTGHARPFDAAADGTAIGEGVGVITLKRLEDAKRDNDMIYAVIRSVGTSSDGKGNAIYAPSAPGQKKALVRAYQDANVTPDTIQMVEAHGTGTPVGDSIELQALTDIYRETKPDGQWCALGSVKSQIGHGKAAAGIAGLIKAALALHHRVIPPSAKVTNPATPLANGNSPFYLPTHPRPWLTPQNHPRRAAVSSFGFGGSNFHCVLEEHPETPAGPDWNGSVQIVAFSAKDTQSLTASIQNLAKSDNLDSLRYTAAETRKHFNSNDPVRFLMAVDGTDQLAEMLATAPSRINASPDTSWETPDGMYYGVGKSGGKIAVVFPGQGNQYPGMLRDIACRFPVFQETLDGADDAFIGNSNGSDSPRLSDVIYPFSSFTDQQQNEQIDTLKLTQYAQPGIGAVSMGAWHVLTHHFKLSVDAAAGHSYGEICAMCAAGMITMDEFHHLSSLRGRLMSAGKEDHGAMAAVLASADDIHTILNDELLDLVIANKNSPNQSVVSGRTNEISRAVDCFRKRGLTITPLKVSAAFHSPLVADASKPFGDHLNNISFQKAAFPVYSNTTGVKYPSQHKKIRNILASQLEKPVEFVAEIRQMATDGIQTFIEIGPGKRMTGLIRAILDDSSIRLIALDSSAGKRSGLLDMARALAALSSMGYPLKLDAWDGAWTPAPDKTASKMQVTLTGSNYIRPKTPLPEFKIQRQPAAPGDPASQSPPNRTADISASKAFDSIQQNLEGLQRLQEQTAQLHQKFLTGQLEAQQAFQHLISQQQHVLTGTPSTPPPAPVAPAVKQTVDSAPPSSQMVSIPPARPEPEVMPTVGNDHTDTVLNVVAEKTGYPIDLLEPDMELDADLGIDSIKRVEIMSALQERLSYLTPIAPEQMASIRSLGDIIGRLNQSAPAKTPNLDIPVSQTPEKHTEERAPEVQSSQNTSPFDTKPIRVIPITKNESILDTIREIVADKTGYPTDLLEPDMELDADLGIDSIKRVEIMSALQESVPGLPAIKPDQLAGLRSISDIGELVTASGGTLGKPGATSEQDQPKPHTGDRHSKTIPLEAASEAPETLYRMDRKILTARPLTDMQRRTINLPEHSEIWITRDDCGLSELLLEEFENRYIPVRIISLDYLEYVELPEDVAGLILVGPRDSCSMDYLNRIFKLIQLVSKKIRRLGKNTAVKPTIISLLRLDGALGLHDKLVDYRPMTAALSGLIKTIRLEWPETHCRIIDVDADRQYEPDIKDLIEEMFYDSPLETGFSSRGKVQLVMENAPIEPNQLIMEPLSPGDWLLATGGARGVTAACVLEIARRFKTNFILIGRSNPPKPEPSWLAGQTNEADIKKAIMANAQKKLSPKELQTLYTQCMNNREILATVDSLKSQGLDVRYESVDLTSFEAVKTFVDKLDQSKLSISGIIHGAGVIADKTIDDKSDGDFDRVIRTKVESLRFLAKFLNLEQMKVVILFSSITARFGRVGQVDYAMANEVLNKFASKVSKMYPTCRTISVNWGPWDGGMVTPELKKLFSKEGVDVIDIRSGARHLARELRLQHTPTHPAPAEVVILGTHDSDMDMPGDIKPSAIESKQQESSKTLKNDPKPPKQKPDESLKEVFTFVITPETAPVLKSHLINKRPVVPMALLMEWSAAGALKQYPDMNFLGLENFRLLKGIILTGNNSVEFECKAGRGKRDGETLRIPVELRGVQPDGRKYVHVSTDVILTNICPEPVLPPPPLDNLEPYPVHQEQLYHDVLFHGDLLQGIRSIEGVSINGILGAVDGSPDPADWLKTPVTDRWITDPMIIDAAFQMLILWTTLKLDMPSLPCGLKRYTQYVKHMPSWANVDVRMRDHKSSQIVSDIYIFDMSGNIVASIEANECITDKGLRDAFQAHRND